MTETGLKILLVEDNPSDGFLIESRLKELPFVDIEIAGRLSDGLDLLAQKSFDVAVLALTPKDSTSMKPLELVKAIRPDLPIVMVGAENEDEVAAAVRADGQDYVVKGGLDSDGLGRSLRCAIERRRAEIALHECQARNSALLAATPETVFGIRSDGTCLYCKLSGDFPTPRPAQLIGMNVTDILPQPLADKCLSYSSQAIATGQVQTFEWEMSHRNQSDHYTVRFIRSSENELLVILRNVTKLKQMEEQLRLSQRLEAIGRLAGGIAHDFNNILTVILGNAQLSLTTLSDNDENRDAFEEIHAAADCAANLTRQLLAFSRKQFLKPVPLDLNAMVHGTETMLRRLIGEDIELVSALEGGLDTIKADPAQIEQILMNLAVNARDAMPQGGKLIFKTDNVDVYETYVGQQVEVKSGPYVMLAVSDTGVGMDAQTRAKALEPFFSTKAPGKGTGLGLSTVYGIVKQSGGYIWIYSEPGMGTTVKIYFPRFCGEGAVPLSRSPAGADQGHGETILLVEDDAKVLKVALRFLDNSGYKVIAAAGIAEALDIVANYRDRIHLLATDVVMPGMSGAELAANILAIRPDLKILYMSGYTDEAIAHHGVLEPGVAFLEKPYSRPDLLNAVRGALYGAGR